jgi:hypothetical protein
VRCSHTGRNEVGREQNVRDPEGVGGLRDEPGEEAGM